MTNIATPGAQTATTGNIPIVGSVPVMYILSSGKNDVEALILTGDLPSPKSVELFLFFFF